MQGDFTRSTFRKENHYSSVRMQQARIMIDADWNEQADITKHRIEAEASDVIGPCGVPAESGGFKVDLTPDRKDLLISPGRLYIDGIMCELEGSPVAIESFPENNSPGSRKVVVSTLSPDGSDLLVNQVVEISGIDDQGVRRSRWVRISGIDTSGSKTLTISENVSDFKGLKNQFINTRATTYSTQPDYPNPNQSISKLKEGITYLVYADVWQRHITSIEDSSIREVALGPDGPDTATRIKTICQVKLKEIVNQGNQECIDAKKIIADPRCRLTACIKIGDLSDKPCIVSSRAGYKRLENQLYRIEVHSGGKVGAATFKWSRENGSVALPISAIKNTDIIDTDDPSRKQLKVTLERRSRDNNLGLKDRDIIEILDDNSVLNNEASPLMRVKGMSPDGLTVILEGNYDRSSELGKDPLKHPLLRRWDHGERDDLSALDSAIPIKEVEVVQPGGTIQPIPIDIEGNIQVIFEVDGEYHTGDYWTIPARTGIEDGGIEWPKQDSKYLPMPPEGIKHHYCSLATFTFKNGTISNLKDCRHIFSPLTLCHQKNNGDRCTAAVASGENNKDLENYLKKLLVEAKEKEISVCLLPGDHYLGKFKYSASQNDSHLRIKGCSLGSRIILKGPISFSNLSSIALENLEISSSSFTNNLSISKCEDVKIRSCRLSIISENPQDISFNTDKKAFNLGDWGYYFGLKPESKRFFAEYSPNSFLFDKSADKGLIANMQVSEILINSKEETQHTPNKPIILADGYELAIKSIDVNANKVYLELSKEGALLSNGSKVISPSREGATIDDKTYYYKRDIGGSKGLITIAVHFKNAFRGSDENLATVDGIWQISDNPQPAVNIAIYEYMAKPLLEIESAGEIQIRENYIQSRITINEKSQLATAIVINDERANAIIENNRILGALSFYGRPRFSSQLIPVDNKDGENEANLQNRFEEKKIRFCKTGAILRVDSNQMTRLTVGERVLMNLEDVLHGSTDISNIYRLGFIANNSVESEGNNFLAKDLILSSNSFDLLPQEMKDGPIISDKVIFVGNSGFVGMNGHMIKIQVFSRKLEKAANLIELVPERR